MPEARIKYGGDGLKRCPHVWLRHLLLGEQPALSAALPPFTNGRTIQQSVAPARAQPKKKDETNDVTHTWVLRGYP